MDNKEREQAMKYFRGLISWGHTSHGLMTSKGIDARDDRLTFHRDEKMHWKSYGINFNKRFIGLIIRTA